MTKLNFPTKVRDVFRRRVRFRSAVTGRYVSRLYALFNKSITVCERD